MVEAAKPIKTSRKDWPKLSNVIVDKHNGKSYLTRQFLGEGGFAVCYQVYDTLDNKEYCCKCIYKLALKSNNEKTKIISEINIMMGLKHQGIVGLHNYFEDETFVYLIMELCENDSMNDLIKIRKRLSEPETRYYMLQLLSAVEFLRSKNIIHRDLKLGNIFINKDMQIKVGDFGLATRLNSIDERKRTICGTPNYIAPEVLFSKNGHSFEADLWSLGIILYTFLVGVPPFQTSKTKVLYERIKNADFTFPEHIVSEEAKELISSILTTIPEDRPPFEAIKSHPFFTNGLVPDFLPSSALRFPPNFDEAVVSPLNPKKSAKSLQRKDSRTNLPSLPTKTEAETDIASTPPPPTLPKAAPETQVFINVKQSFTSTLYRLYFGIQSQQIHNQNKGSTLEPPNFIVKWIDHGDAFGLGFELVDGTTGVFFKDSTSLVQSPDHQYFEFVYYPPKWSVEGAKKDVYKVSQLPVSLNKKFKVHRNYVDFMFSTLNHAISSSQDLTTKLPEHLLHPPPYDPKLNASNEGSQLPYLTKFLSTKRCSLFRLSNGTVQINFKPCHTKLILSQNGSIVTVIDADGDMACYRMSQVLAHFLQSPDPKFINLKRKKEYLGYKIDKEKLGRFANVPHDKQLAKVSWGKIVECLEYLVEVLDHLIQQKANKGEKRS